MADEASILSGLRVIEYAEHVAGPCAGRHLAELGAEVIKVEPPGRGDPARRLGPFAHDQPALDSSLLFNYLNVNKLGLTLDLETPTGRDILNQLVRSADVFLYGGPAPALDRLNLGPDAWSGVTERLITAYVTPFGLTGPYRDWAGGELVSMHLSGLALATPGAAGPERVPLKPGGRHALMVAGLHGALAVLQALFARQATGQGQTIDLSEWEPIASFQLIEVARFAFAGQPSRRGDALGVPRYRANDGFISISPMQEHMWRAMVQLLGSPEWAERPEFATHVRRRANQVELQRLVEAWTADQSKQTIYEQMQSRRVQAFPDNTVAETIDSPHLRERGYFTEIPLPNGDRARGPGPRYQFGEGFAGVRRSAPRLGEHSAQILTERLGFSREDVCALFEVGII